MNTYKINKIIDPKSKLNTPWVVYKFFQTDFVFDSFKTSAQIIDLIGLKNYNLLEKGKKNIFEYGE